jgi:hypothetical protein
MDGGRRLALLALEGKIMAEKTEAEREVEVVELIKRAQDPDDPYTGHHGDDTTAAR